MEVLVQFRPPHNQVMLQVTQDAEIVVVHPHLLEMLQLRAKQVLHQEKSTSHQARLQQMVKFKQILLMLQLMAMLYLIRLEKENLKLQQVDSMEQQQKQKEWLMPM